jgi:hypothetical protein
MKCFLITILFFCIAVVAYAQTSLPSRGNQCYKSNFSNDSYFKGYGTAPLTGHQSKNTVSTNTSSYRNDVPVMSVMPTLKMWLLNPAAPNPFMKEED